MKTTNYEIKTNEEPKEKKMTRKAAISKAGFIAISAATTMMLLPKLASAGTSGGSGNSPAAPDSGGSWKKRTPSS